MKIEHLEEKLATARKKLNAEEQQIVKGIYSQLEAEVNSSIGKIPSLDWAAYQSTLCNQQERLRAYYEKMAEDLTSSEFVKELLEHGRANRAFDFMRDQYPYTEQVALEALDIAFEALKIIKTL
jgi:hypothetical protein